MNRLTKTILLSLMAICYMSCEEKPVQNTPENPINIILMIGDGMGLTQISTAFYFGEETPNFEQFKDIGFIKTPSTSHTITDSAAGATAFSTGQKTYKRAIGMSKDSLPIPTIIETLHKKGYQSGLVSLTPITHATPGAFYAHVKDRDLHEDIALDLVKSNIDFFAAGGLKYLKHRTDQKDLYTALIAKNYKLDSIELSKYDINKKNGYLLAHEGLPSKLEGRKAFFQEATQLGLNYLTEKEKPFFLMLEGSYIDWGGHAMDAELLKQEVLDFDKTLGVVLKYINKHPNTLLVVTADHETGGVSIGKSYVIDEATGERSEEVDNVTINFNNDQHSGTLIPVFAKGKGAAHFRGIYENNEIYHKILKAIHQK
ncbi:alkaline phosphatase [Polaribacter sp. Asnod6-C07]|uniref:alkaline phosphatase n=1 Tax=Polaribacter sp. Asnod6-C07 TaxID=3160582 RepID=UPI00386CEF55